MQFLSCVSVTPARALSSKIIRMFGGRTVLVLERGVPAFPRRPSIHCKYWTNLFIVYIYPKKQNKSRAPMAMECGGFDNWKRCDEQCWPLSSGRDRDFLPVNLRISLQTFMVFIHSLIDCGRVASIIIDRAQPALGVQPSPAASDLIRWHPMFG